MNDSDSPFDSWTADSIVVNASGSPGHATSPSPPISGGAYAQWTADGYLSLALFPPAVQVRGVPASLGLNVTTRNFSWGEMARRAWGSEFSAPDHRVYEFSNGRGFDSTDRGKTGIYRPPGR